MKKKLGVKMEQEVSYRQLMKRLKAKEKENQKLRQMLTLENISTLEMMVRECMRYNRDQIRKIAMEIQLTEYDKENVEQVRMMVEFLENMCEELKRLTEV